MNNPNGNINIAIVDDEALIVMLLTDYFSKYDGIDVIMTATDGSEIIDMVKNAKVIPDVILLDMQMKTLNGVDTTGLLKQEYPEIKIIVISSHYKKSFMGYMMKLGVNAFIPKGISTDELVLAIKDVYNKGFYFMDEQIEVMRNQISSNVPEPTLNSEDALSKREIEVLKLLCQQNTAQQIADKLFITKRTVEGHKSNLLLKTSAKNMIGLVIYAIQKKIIEVDEFFYPE